MMMKRHKSMLATSALGAALAFTTVPAMAQDATQQATQPVTTQPAPTTTTTTTTTTTATPPAPTTDSAPPTTDSTAATTTETATPKAKTTARTRTASSSATAAAAARRAEAQSLARTLAARSVARAAPAASEPARTVPAPAQAPETAPVATAAGQPTPTSQVAKPAPTSSNDPALELGGGALALLALGGAAYALTRRRKSDEEVWADEDVAYHEEPVAEPMELDRPADGSTIAAAPVAVGTVAASTPRHDPVRDERSGMLAPPMSAFGWNATDPRHDTTEPARAGDDRHEGESWVERAKRGPSPDNPSLSLKKRLKRAAFFDQRERDVAEGNAVPVNADAGLPENLEEHA